MSAQYLTFLLSYLLHPGNGSLIFDFPGEKHPYCFLGCLPPSLLLSGGENKLVWEEGLGRFNTLQGSFAEDLVSLVVEQALQWEETHKQF